MDTYHLQLKLKALVAVNEIRLKQGRDPIPELPKGLRGNQCECPIARALTAHVGRWESINGAVALGFDDEEAAPKAAEALGARVLRGGGLLDLPLVKAPTAISDFAVLFDAGRFPRTG